VNPLTDELSPEAKTELAAMFRELKRWFPPMNVERQRFFNRTWNLYR
jgi:hypothetical protein